MLSQASSTQVHIHAQDSFSSPTAVFVNLVWFVSLMLSLMYAFVATMLQQWTRRYPTYSTELSIQCPCVHPRVLCRQVPYLEACRSTACLLFFFWTHCICILRRYHRLVTYCNIVRFCVLWYVILTLVAAHIRNCPYQNPLSTPLWFCTQVIQLSVFSVVHLLE